MVCVVLRLSSVMVMNMRWDKSCIFECFSGGDKERLGWFRPNHDFQFEKENYLQKPNHETKLVGHLCTEPSTTINSFFIFKWGWSSLSTAFSRGLPIISDTDDPPYYAASLRFTIFRQFFGARTVNAITYVLINYYQCCRLGRIDGTTVTHVWHLTDGHPHGCLLLFQFLHFSPVIQQAGF